jgi:hypothetical protein
VELKEKLKESIITFIERIGLQTLIPNTWFNIEVYANYYNINQSLEW